MHRGMHHQAFQHKVYTWIGVLVLLTHIGMHHQAFQHKEYTLIGGLVLLMHRGMYGAPSGIPA